MAKSNDKIHQRQQISYSWLGTGIFKCRKWWIKPGFIVLNLSLVWQLHQIPLYLQQFVNKTDICLVFFCILYWTVVKYGNYGFCFWLLTEKSNTNVQKIVNVRQSTIKKWKSCVKWAIKGPNIIKVWNNSNIRTYGLVLVSKSKYMGHEQETTTKLQPTEFLQSHWKCGVVKHGIQPTFPMILELCINTTQAHTSNLLTFNDIQTY